MYDGEQKLIRALRRMAKNTSNRELAKGSAPMPEQQSDKPNVSSKCSGPAENPRHPWAGIDGLIGEYSTFVREESPEASVLVVFASKAALKVEHYEIGYKGLIDRGKQLRLRDEVGLLRETLQEKEQTAQALGRLSKSLGQAIPSGEDEKGESTNEAGQKEAVSRQASELKAFLGGGTRWLFLFTRLCSQLYCSSLC